MGWIKELVKPGRREWEEVYRNRWQYDRRVRSTHGNNCTGGCSWWVYVKDGIVTWEMQALDYPRLEPGIPPYEPRGCQRGISYSWYVYSPQRIKHPAVRGVLLDLWRQARREHDDPVAAWTSIVSNDTERRRYQQARGKGGFRRATWDEALEIIAASLMYTVKKYGPDRVVGFSPIPAMSMVSYAAGSRFLQLLGGTLLSFYDLYADFPPASPETWGEKTDVSESADWYNSKFIVSYGSNLDMTRTPDAHFAVEARDHGAKLVVLSPDFSQVSRHADWWIPVQAGMDAAFWMAVDHVIAREFHVDRRVPYFTEYLKTYTDAPFLVALVKNERGYIPARFVRAGEIAGYEDEENPDWKCCVYDGATGRPAVPLGQIGFRWQDKKGQWNLRMEDGRTGRTIDPLLSFIESHDEVLPVLFPDRPKASFLSRGVPARRIETSAGDTAVATVYDLLLAHLGAGRGLGGDYPEDYDDPDKPFTPAWQEAYTGISRSTVIRFAREWAATAERTGGRCMVIIGAGANHWYHSNLNYRSCITALLLCGCVGVNGGGLNHYTGQERVGPAASWKTLATALDWVKAPRLMNGPSFHYVHSDQWRYDGPVPDVRPVSGHFAREHAVDIQAEAVRMGWLPFYPQFERSPVDLVREAEAAGAGTEEEIITWVVDRLKSRRLHFSVEDPDAPENWPRVWLIWRANAILSSTKGHEFLLRHYLGTHSNAIAAEAGKGLVREVCWRDAAPQGKMDLVVDLNFRLDTSALYSDIVLPAAGWYEKNDLNTTDLHSFIHPMGEAVPPCWESRTDWEIFKALAARFAALAKVHAPGPFRDLVAMPLLHDSPDEIAQPRVQDWRKNECEPVPGKTMPRFSLVTRDYANLDRQFASLGPGLRADGVEDHGVRIPVGDLYDALAENGAAESWDGKRYPSIARDVDAAGAILHFAPETNGEIAYRGFLEKEKSVGLPLADLAAASRDVRCSFFDLTRQPRRLLTSPCWSGIMNGGRPYAAYVMNVERLVPWRTLTGRQQLYLDHEAYRAFEESLPTFKPPVGIRASGHLDLSVGLQTGTSKTLNLLTPHGKWNIHTTYADSPPMLTLSRGGPVFWLNDKDAAEIGVGDNDWIEVHNDNGVSVLRAVVSFRIPRGIGVFYHAPERTIGIPKSPLRLFRRAGVHNSLTRLHLKPVLMVGGYAQHSYRFNDYGPPASDRDTYVVVRKLPGKPRWV